MKKLHWKTKHGIASAPLFIGLCLAVYAPNWAYTPFVFILSWGWSVFYFFAFTFGMFGIGRSMNKEIADEDDTYRASLKPVPVWERPPPEDIKPKEK